MNQPNQTLSPSQQRALSAFVNSPAFADAVADADIQVIRERAELLAQLKRQLAARDKFLAGPEVAAVPKLTDVVEKLEKQLEEARLRLFAASHAVEMANDSWHRENAELRARVAGVVPSRIALLLGKRQEVIGLARAFAAPAIAEKTGKATVSLDAYVRGDAEHLDDADLDEIAKRLNEIIAAEKYEVEPAETRSRISLPSEEQATSARLRNPPRVIEVAPYAKG